MRCCRIHGKFNSLNWPVRKGTLNVQEEFKNQQAVSAMTCRFDSCPGQLVREIRCRKNARLTACPEGERVRHEHGQGLNRRKRRQQRKAIALPFKSPLPLFPPVQCLRLHLFSSHHFAHQPFAASSASASSSSLRPYSRSRMSLAAWVRAARLRKRRARVK